MHISTSPRLRADRRAATRSKAAPGRGRCRICHCTHWHPCPEGCAWVDRNETLCTACERFGNVPREHVIAALRACHMLPSRGKVTAGALAEAIFRANAIFDGFTGAGINVTLRAVQKRS